MATEQLDAVVDPLLTDLPYCRWFRGLHAWGRKLFDIPCHAGGAFAYVDSDILFIRPFDGLFDSIDHRVGITFMHSYANILSIRWTQRFASWWRYSLADRCNAGFLVVDPRAHSLNLIEEFLRDAERHPRVLLAEQTAWAMLAARSNFAYLDPEQVRFPLSEGPKSERAFDQAIAYHFVGGTRHQLPAYVEAADRIAAQGESRPVRLRTRTGRMLGPTRHLIDAVAFRLRNKRWRTRGVFR